MEKYLEYEHIKERYNSVQALFAQVLLEKERLLTKTLPNAIRYDGLKVQSSQDGNPLEEYMISVDDEGLDIKLNHYRQALTDWRVLLEIKEDELRKSPEKIDRIYVLKCIDGYGINRILRVTNYSRAQLYRFLERIYKTCDKMRQNETK